MGCVVSNSVPSNEEKELPQFISGEDIQIVQESWLLVQPELDNIGVYILKRFLETNSDLKHLFYTKLRTEDMELEDVETAEFDQANLRMHASIVMDALGAAIECLQDSVHLTLLLIGIGERHAMYGVKANMIPLMWPAIVTTLEEHLGEQFDNRVGNAWDRVFQYLEGKMIEGISRWTKQK